MQTLVKDFSDVVKDGAQLPEGWKVRVIINDDNMTYLAVNEPAREFLVVDPVREDWEQLVREVKSFSGYRFLGVIDTHTHADHVSSAGELAEHFGAPLIMHRGAPSSKVHLRVSRDVELPSVASPLKLLVTPGHTQDCITPIWGPFIFSGDMILWGDTGRDDLPGGDPLAHYQSLQKIRAAVTPDMILAPGHDGEGGRLSSWRTQLEVNASLTQDQATFVKEAGSYSGPAPKLLKESLFENFK
jgi:sulfur dioxygenase